MKLTNRNPQPGLLSQIPLPVLVTAWVLAVVLAASCLFWVLLSPSGNTLVAATTATPVKVVKATVAPTKPAQPAGTTKPAANTPAAGSQPTKTPKPTATPTTLPINEKFGYGIQVNGINDGSSPENSMSMVGQLKMTWIKQQVKWGVMENQKGQLYQPDIDYLDDLVKRANQSGVKVMLSIISAPKWSHPAIDSIEAPPDDFKNYATFVGQLVDRYKSKNTPIHAIEVWNEQNLDREWLTKPQKIDPSRYMELLKLTYQTVKAKDKNIVVISGALSPTGCDDGVTCMDDFKYLEQMVKFGLLDNADCVGIHHNGYNLPPDVAFENAPKQPKAAKATFRGPFENLHHSWSFYTTLNKSAEIVKKQKPLCITEFGWPSSEGITAPVRQGFEFAKDNTLQDQATYITQAFQLMKQWGFVKIAFLWNLNFFGGSDDPKTSDNPPYSILNPQGMPRPAFDALGAMPKQ